MKYKLEKSAFFITIHIKANVIFRLNLAKIFFLHKKFNPTKIKIISKIFIFLCNSLWMYFYGIKLQFCKYLTRKTFFLERCSWFKFNNLELGLGVALKFYTSVAKRLKPQIKNVLGIIPTFVEVTGKNCLGASN